MPSSTVYVARGEPSKFYLNGKRISVDTAFGLYQKKANFVSFGVSAQQSRDQYAANKQILLGHYDRDVIVYKITEADRTYHRFFYPSTATGNPRFKGAFTGLFVPMYGYAQDGTTLLKGRLQRQKQYPQKRPGLAFFPWQRDLMIHMLENSGALLNDIRKLETFLSSYINTPGELSVTINRHIVDVTQTDFLQTSSMKSQIKDWLQSRFVIQVTDVTGEPLPPLVNSPIYMTETPSEIAYKEVPTAMMTRQSDERSYPRYKNNTRYFPVRQPWMDSMDSQ